jgi:hypothetical protein
VTFTIKTYTITVTSGSEGTVTPGSTVVNYGGSETFSITPDPGYHVVNVYVDGDAKGAVNSFTFDNVTANHTIEAIFAINSYTVTASVGGNPLGGSVTPLERTVNHGSSTTFTVTTNVAYTASVSEGTLEGTTWTIPNVTSTHTATVTFTIKTYTITVTSGSGGMVTPGSTVVNYWGSETFNITPDPSYHVENVLIDGASVGAVASYPFNNVTANHTIEATFAINTYTITVTSGSGGAGSGGGITPSGVVTVNYWANQTFSITPNTGYHVADVLVDGASVGAVASYTFNNVTANHTISATFAINTYTITVASGSGGAVTPGSTVLNHGANQTFSITLDPGYHVENVSVDGAFVGAVTTYTFNSVTSNHTISATFAINTYTITVTSGPGGTVTPGSTVVNHGANQTFSITPNTGYHTVDVIVDGASVGAVAFYPFNNVTSNHTISATFAINTYTLTVTISGSGSGTVTSSLPGIACGTDCTEDYNYGTPVMLTAVPLAESVFAGWSGTCTGIGPCLVTIDEAKVVTTIFIKQQSFPFIDDFSTDKGWFGYESGGWERGPAVSGGGEYGSPDPGIDYSASTDNNILGFAIGEDYPNDLSEKSIISPSIDCTGQERVFLKFRRYLNVESSRPEPNVEGDHARIYVSNDGINWGGPVWENPPIDVIDNQWVPVVLDISSIAANQATIYIKFTMGPTNSSRRFSGWNIDDLEVTSEAIYPSEGTYGTELMMTGSGFASKKGKVLMGGTSLSILDWTDNLVRFRLSKVLPLGIHDVMVQPGEPRGAPSVVKGEGFMVRSPEIHAIEEGEGSAYDQITIKGKFFGTKKGKVYLEYEESGQIIRKSCKVTKWWMDAVTNESEIFFIVPKMLPDVFDVVVDPYSTLQEAEEEHGFEVKAPKIESVNPTFGSFRQEITISGNYFGSGRGGKVYLGYESKGRQVEKRCSIVSWSDDEIVFTVPNLPIETYYDVIVTNSVGSDTLLVGFIIK